MVKSGKFQLRYQRGIIFTVFAMSIQLINQAILQLPYFKEEENSVLGVLVLLIFLSFTLFSWLQVRTKKSGWFYINLFIHLLLLASVILISVKQNWKISLFVFLLPLIFVSGFIFLLIKYPSGSIYALLERAGKKTNTVQDGYTNRPFHLGAIENSVDEIVSFSEYLHKKGWAVAITEENRIKLIFSSGLFWYFHFIKPDYNKNTYAEIDFKGNISIHIAERDYKKFKQELTFDELCDTFGNLIIFMFNMFKENQQFKIRTLMECGYEF